MGFWKRLSGRDPYADLTVEELIREAQRAVGSQDADAALRAMLCVLQRERDNVRAYLMLGAVCHLKRWNANAVACFRRALDFDPDNRDAKQDIERIQAYLEEAYRGMSEVDRRAVELLRVKGQMDVDAAYDDLRQGVFRPRV